MEASSLSCRPVSSISGFGEWPQSNSSAASGHAQGWGTAIECQEAACGFVAGHKYLNTKLIMDTADPSYDQTKGTTNATGELVTSDGGKTWTIDTIVVGSYTYN